MGNSLSIWTIYENPKDYPGIFVARRREVSLTPVATSDILTGASLEDVRAQLPPGLMRMPANAEDDQSVVESWL